MVKARCESSERGFTYLWVLAAIAVLSVGLLAASEVWVTSARRQRLVELDWIGAQYTKAIGSYYQSTPGAIKAYPSSFQELIEDRRYLTMRRHLRVIYPNPFTAKTDWEIVRSTDGRMRGVKAKVPGEDGTTFREYIYRPS
jgi:type II secretory pathway pseudopilin PulG